MPSGHYYIAINGSSCAMFPIALREPFIVKPKPHILIGFPTLEEAKAAQAICLQSPIAMVDEQIAAWRLRPDVRWKLNVVHDKQTKGQTVWMEV